MSNKVTKEEIDGFISEMDEHVFIPGPFYNRNGDYVFSDTRRTRTYYIDDPKRSVQDLREYIIKKGENPNTKEHEKLAEKIKEYFKNLKNLKNPNGNSPGVKKCKRSQKLNRKTSRCRKTPCAKGETRDVYSRRCRKKKCSPRKTRDVTSHRCRKKKSPGRKSPKRKSPKRKSPKRKSPGRKSPKRKSPKRKSPTKKSRK